MATASSGARPLEPSHGTEGQLEGGRPKAGEGGKATRGRGRGRGRAGGIPVPSRSRGTTPVPTSPTGENPSQSPAGPHSPRTGGPARRLNGSLSPGLTRGRPSTPRSPSALSSRSDQSEGASSAASVGGSGKSLPGQHRGRDRAASGKSRGARGGRGRGKEERRRTTSNLSRSSSSATQNAKEVVQLPAPETTSPQPAAHLGPHPSPALDTPSAGEGSASDATPSIAGEGSDSLDAPAAEHTDIAALLAKAAAELSDESLPTTPLPAVDFVELGGPALALRADSSATSAPAPSEVQSAQTSPTRPRPVPLTVDVAGSTNLIDIMTSDSNGDDSLLDTKPPSYLIQSSSSFAAPSSADYNAPIADVNPPATGDADASEPVTEIPPEDLPPLSPSPTLPTSPVQARPDPFDLGGHAPQSVSREGSVEEGAQWDQLAALSLSAFGMRRRGSSAAWSEQRQADCEGDLAGSAALADDADDTVAPPASSNNVAEHDSASLIEAEPQFAEASSPVRPPLSLPPSFRHLLDPSLHQESPRNSMPPSPTKELHRPLGGFVEPKSWPPAPYGIENVPVNCTSRGGAVSAAEPAQDSGRGNGEQIDVGAYLDQLRRDLLSSTRDNQYSTSEESPVRPIRRADSEDSFDDDEEKRKMIPQQTKPPSLTMSVWRGSGDLRTRFAALGASLAVNLFLPFVNGVMLGFGEITAREICGWLLGWGPAAGGRRRWWEPAPRSGGDRHPARSEGSSTVPP